MSKGRSRDPSLGPPASPSCPVRHSSNGPGSTRDSGKPAMKLKRPSPASVWLLALALAASACSSPDSEGRANLSQGDSAGVRIVVNPASALDRDLDWTIETTPWLELGADPNDEATQFFTIDRVGQMGQVIVVADGGNDQLRYFDLEGNHLRSAGRSGEGPGEFRWLRLVPSFRYDSLVLHDPFLRRLTSASAAGELRAEASVADSGESSSRRAPAAIAFSPPRTRRRSRWAWRKASSRTGSGTESTTRPRASWERSSRRWRATKCSNGGGELHSAFSRSRPSTPSPSRPPVRAASSSPREISPRCGNTT